jgi:hypothetical protein
MMQRNSIKQIAGGVQDGESVGGGGLSAEQVDRFRFSCSYHSLVTRLASMTDSLPPPRLDLLVHSPTPSSLIPVLEQLLEASPVLTSKLAPDLHATFKQAPPKTYSQLLETAATLVAKWDVADQALFLGSHPRIGETIGLSSASAKEQQPGQGQVQTPGEVLKRLSVSVPSCSEVLQSYRKG